MQSEATSMASDTTCIWTDSLSDNSAGRKSSAKIFAAVAVCYLCMCGGNLMGFTSAAIPSMRGVDSNAIDMDKELLHQPSSIMLNLSMGDYDDDPITFLDAKRNSSTTTTTVTSSKSFLPATIGWLNFEFSSVEEFQNLTDAQASWIGGLLPLGAFAGSLLAPLPMGCMGPRGSTLLVAAPLFILSWMLIGFAPVVRIVYAGRFLGGVSVGLSTSVAPVYIMDVAPTNLRGALGTLPQCFIVIGILTSFLLGSLFNWRQCAMICLTFVIPGMCLLVFTAESPKWLLNKRRLKEAEKAYFRLNGHSMVAKIEFDQMKQTSLYHYKEQKSNLSNCEIPMIIDNKSSKIQEDEELQQQKIRSVQSPSSTTSIEKSIKSQLLSLKYEFSQPGTLKATVVVFLIMICQQFTGINGVNFYTVTIFREALGSEAHISSHMSSIIVAITLNVATFSSIFLIEKLGRKLLLLLSVTFMGLGAFSIGTFFYLKTMEVEGSKSLSWLPLASLIVFVVAFSLGEGPVCYIIGAELLDSNIRSIINPLCVGVNWLSVFIVAKTFPDLVSLFGICGTFWMYGVFAILIFLFTFIWVPETKNKSEQDIKNFFIN